MIHRDAIDFAAALALGALLGAGLARALRKVRSREQVR